MEERKCSFCSTTKNYYSSSTKFFSYAVWLLLQFRVLKSARAASAFPRVFGRVAFLLAKKKLRLRNVQSVFSTLYLEVQNILRCQLFVYHRLIRSKVGLQTADTRWDLESRINGTRGPFSKRTYLFQGMQPTSLERDSEQQKKRNAAESSVEDMMRAHLLWTLTVRISPLLPPPLLLAILTYYPYQGHEVLSAIEGWWCNSWHQG